MAKTTSIAPSKRKYFTQTDEILDLPNLVDHQNDSFYWFVNEGLGELLAEISPIDDYTGTKLSLSFKDYKFEEPKTTEAEAKDDNISFEAPLKATVVLTNKITGEVKEQEIYLGDYPWMTSRGTFIVNGTERVVVSQLIRSAGVFFTSEQHTSSRLYGAKVIPGRGAWLEFETSAGGAIYVKIDRKRKIPVTTLLKALGLSESQIKQELSHVDQGKLNYTSATLEKDPAKGYVEGNVQWLAWCVNRAKGDLELNDFFDMCEIVLQHRKEQRLSL